MTPGSRTPAEAAAALTAIGQQPLSAVLPAVWQNLMPDVVRECAAALRRNDPYNIRDQAILPLALRLLRAGRHAAWTLAHAALPGGVTQTDWAGVALWHHGAWTELNAGWQRRLPAGTNAALAALEANRMTLAPLPVRTTATADRWLAALERDPLDMTAAEAQQGLPAIAAGVWISP